MANLRSIFLLFIIVEFFVACSGKTSSNEEAFRYFNKSFESSGVTINKSTETLLADLEAKLTDPTTVNRAQIWFPRASQVREFTKIIYTDIENLKHKLLEVSNPNEELGQFKSFSMEMKKLDEELKNYNLSIMAIDSEFSQVFPGPAGPYRIDSSDIRFFPTYLFSRNISVKVAISLMYQIENNIRVIENRLIQFSYLKIGSTLRDFYAFTALVTINSLRSEPGTEMEITAGVGKFERSANPKVFIEGKSLPQSEDGAFHYKFNAPQAPGKYRTQVKVEYTDQEGKINVMTKNVVYSVVK